MRRLTPVLVALPLLLQAGCWPRIPGQWDDYAAPEDASVMGQFIWTRYTGGYWSSGTPEPFGEVWFGAFEEPKQAWPWKRFTDDLDSCANNQNLPGWWQEFAPIGSDNIVIRTTGETLQLDWYGNGLPDTYLFDGVPIYYKAIPPDKLGMTDVMWRMDELSLEGFEPFAAEQFVYVPPTLEVVSPALGGDSLATISRGQDLYVEWNGPEDVPWVFIEVVLLDSDQAAIDITQCVLVNEGSTTIPRSMLPQWNAATYAMIQVGSYDQVNRVIPGAPGGLRMGGISSVLGAGVLE